MSGAATILATVPCDVETEPVMAEASFEGYTVGSIQMNSISLVAGQSSSNLTFSNYLNISNATAFRRLSTNMIYQKTVKWHLRGTCTITAKVGMLALKFWNVKLDKDVDFAGVGGLNNVSVSSYDLFLKGDMADITAYATLMNPSVVSVDPVGSVVFNTYIAGYFQGNQTMRDVVLRPGSNTVYTSGLATPANMSILSDVFSNFLAGRGTLILARAVGTTPCTVPLYNAMFEGLEMSYLMPGNQMQLIVGALMEVDLKIIFEGFAKGHLWVPAQLYLDYMFHAQTEFLDLELDVMYNGTVLGGFHGSLRDNVSHRHTNQGQVLDSRRPDHCENQHAQRASILDCAWRGVQVRNDAAGSERHFHLPRWQPGSVTVLRPPDDDPHVP
eukprot:CAMPEP_0114546468 /NCGR_PEP_ID=MMETSP0114-20121206/3950_1 /TAXON_ID=31324 /ORGANISM="Goniomonas sp, Strain m" /LENGTH=384 /DNA_ID=CAMNT_0001730965 /DNA_START=209 /DNA_END=1360 /DNA_ORIENTATION=+